VDTLLVPAGPIDVDDPPPGAFATGISQRVQQLEAELAAERRRSKSATEQSFLKNRARKTWRDVAIGFGWVLGLQGVLLIFNSGIVPHVGLSFSQNLGFGGFFLVAVAVFQFAVRRQPRLYPEVVRTMSEYRALGRPLTRCEVLTLSSTWMRLAAPHPSMWWWMPRWLITRKLQARITPQTYARPLSYVSIRTDWSQHFSQEGHNPVVWMQFLGGPVNGGDVEFRVKCIFSCSSPQMPLRSEVSYGGTTQSFVFSLKEQRDLLCQMEPYF